MQPQGQAIDFNERPFLVIWEITQACDLACVHCRACAQPARSALAATLAGGGHRPPTPVVAAALGSGAGLVGAALMAEER